MNQEKKEKECCEKCLVRDYGEHGEEHPRYALKILCSNSTCSCHTPTERETNPPDSKHSTKDANYLSTMNTSKVSRVEVIDHTKDLEDGGGRVYVFRDDNASVELSLQDEERTLKVFIKHYE